MQRRQVLFSVVGLAFLAAAAQADVPKTAKILGKDYDVIVSKRVGTFKNGVTVELQKVGGDQEVVPFKANIAFAPGGTPDADRLFVAAATQDNPDVSSDGFYMLQGTNELGVFGPEFSNAHIFFRGSREVHGRIQAVTFLNDTDTGSMKDRNLVVFSFTAANMLRWYDLTDLLASPTSGRTEENAFRDLSVHRIIQSGITEEVGGTDPPREELPDDPNMSIAGWMGTALAPNGNLILVGPANGDWEFSVIDAVKGTSFFPVLTPLAETAAGEGGEIDTSQTPHAMAHFRGDEYLILATTGDPNWNEEALAGTTLYHVRITQPSDLTQEGKLGIELLGQTDLTETGIGQTPSGSIFGVAVGRPVAENDPIIYLADWGGNLFTLRPSSATAGQ